MKYMSIYNCPQVAMCISHGPRESEWEITGLPQDVDAGLLAGRWNSHVVNLL